MHGRWLRRDGQEGDLCGQILGYLTGESHRILNISATTATDQDAPDGCAGRGDHQYRRGDCLSDGKGLGRRKEELLCPSAFCSDDSEVISRFLCPPNNFSNRIAEFGDDLDFHFLFPKYLRILA